EINSIFYYIPIFYGTAVINLYNSFNIPKDFNEKWTDEKLYKKYKLTKEEIDFIELKKRPME
ncbi:MAG TPA: restriction endonuclease, partial [Spirochaetota bacterium]|nr:restriction endonuclease [Spirochaetota bacterium]